MIFAKKFMIWTAAIMLVSLATACDTEEPEFEEDDSLRFVPEMSK
ncbi:hypothetical protein PCC7424_0639 [Gloeothece citriformis PCC 7424]|uniref:Secreted protein n=1 Tax=Gloeothece citriformis (strain PCC 7424) TaxID=65393 RepID=B7KES4_GLOC7|nr:hypothetical protein [Gloeothece citriformis]ACK69099.1 hypothetical protein PCC7424_0639 [Gloeothece citriformis PCC 7424]